MHARCVNTMKTLCISIHGDKTGVNTYIRIPMIYQETRFTYHIFMKRKGITLYSIIYTCNHNNRFY